MILEIKREDRKHKKMVNVKKIKDKKVKNLCSGLLLLCLLTGCGQTETDGKIPEEGQTQQAEQTQKDGQIQEETQKEAAESGQETPLATDTFAGESAADGHVDFDALQQINPDIFAWLYVPGTGIDVPVLQSHESDEYYKSHTPDGEEGAEGAVYTEMPNLMNMCDFNTILHGRDLEEKDWLYGLHKYEDADFFQENEVFYLYLPDNVLTYEIVAAYYDDGTDILRRYDYTTYSGCQSYLDDMYGYKSMNKNMREGWDDLTPYHFLVTLDGSIREDNTQYVVVGALIEDPAGTIDRMILE